MSDNTPKDEVQPRPKKICAFPGCTEATEDANKKFCKKHGDMSYYDRMQATSGIGLHVSKNDEDDDVDSVQDSSPPEKKPRKKYTFKKTTVQRGRPPKIEEVEPPITKKNKVKAVRQYPTPKTLAECLTEVKTPVESWGVGSVGTMQGPVIKPVFTADEGKIRVAVNIDTLIELMHRLGIQNFEIYIA